MSTLSSMTGFARVEGEWLTDRFVWEVRSVNARGLDIRCRVPSGFEAMEPDVRARLSKKLTRGSVNLTFSVVSGAASSNVVLNRAALDALMTSVKEAAKDYGVDAPGLEALLSARGVIEVSEPALSDEDRESRAKAMMTALDAAIASLIEARKQEGKHLASLLTGHIDRMEELLEAARSTAETQPEMLRERLHRQVSELMTASKGLDETRLTQELALLATKADVREELDRLAAHIAAARDLLAADGAVGRKFDFLTQEFGREANTLCSKAVDIALTRIGLDMKAVIDQIREQVQNVE
jgi:uncharacterized protein (TIGR00255 family)